MPQRASVPTYAAILSPPLVPAATLTGTGVYNLDGEKLGVIDDVMIDKFTGRAIYAVMSFGGFLGLGEKYHPLPWAALRYDPLRGGYMVNLDKQRLERAPSYGRDKPFDWTPEYGRKVDDYYDVPTYWI